MYNPIKLTIPETVELNTDNLKIHLGININESFEEFSEDKFYSEAVFANGRQTLSPLISHIERIKEELDNKIAEQEKNPSHKFEPKEYWRSLNFKNFEDELKKIFGLRNVEVQPWVEKYISEEKIFESKECNCIVFTLDRFPIDGLVTDNGFYDKTHSVLSDIRISLGLIKALTAEEIMAILLHEFGHNIDPALVDIKYVEANILSKYMTDRKKEIDGNEKKVMKKFGKDNKLSFFNCMLNSIQWTFSKFIDYFNPKTKSSLFGDLFLSKDKKEEKRINKIREMVRSEKDEFNRQNYSEAFADNFARMYGYGPQLMSALKKLSKNIESQVNSRYKKEKARQQIIFYITENALKDEHKTDIHRARSLIKEYENDLKDPNIPEEVKKSIRKDKEELEKILKEYLNNFGDLQNRINTAINEELSQIQGQSSSVNESVEDEYEEFDEAKSSDSPQKRIKANLERFKKEFKYDPGSKTVEVDGKRYKINLDINNPYEDANKYGQKNTKETVARSVYNVKRGFFTTKEELDYVEIVLTKEDFRGSYKSLLYTFYHEIGHAKESYDEDHYRKVFSGETISRKEERDKFKSKEHKQSGHQNSSEYIADRYAANKLSPAGQRRHIEKLYQSNPDKVREELRNDNNRAWINITRGIPILTKNIEVTKENIENIKYNIQHARSSVEQSILERRLKEQEDLLKKITDDLNHRKTLTREDFDKENQKYFSPANVQANVQRIAKNKTNIQDIGSRQAALKDPKLKSSNKDLFGESVIFYEDVEEFITESKKAMQKLQKDMNNVSQAERNRFHDIFDKALGKKVGCSLARDKNGYYVTTHRARSKSYPSIDKIPVSVVKFIDSTC